MEIEPSYDKKLKCFNCDTKFTSIKIRSRFVRVVSYDTDFKTEYPNSEINPLFYNVNVCPRCGFSFTDDFTPYFAPGTKEAINAQISAKWSERSFGAERDIDEAIETYKLAYLSAIIKKEKAITTAGLVLRLAWLYRDKELSVEENRFMTIARDLYVASYGEGDYIGTQMSEARVLYMIGELSRRIGDDDEAIRNFSRVIEKQRTTLDPKAVEMAKDRWQEMRTAKDQQASLSIKK